MATITMKRATLCLFWLLGLVIAQDSSSIPQSQSGSQSPSVLTLTGSQRSLTRGDYGPIPTVPSDFQGSSFATASFTGNSTLNITATASSSTEDPLTEIGGRSSETQTATGTETRPPRPSNTQPCNNYPEFCERKYSNITEVCAHNSPFTRQNNVARNQDYGVTQQLNDGIRMLQGQAHMMNGTLYYCHSSCDLLNAGPVEDYLREVTTWLEAHPFEVITIIFGNYDWQEKDSEGNALVTSADYVDPIEKSGLRRYIYQPPKTAMTLDDWPTLGEMILQNKRVVTFIDYNFDTTTVPYMLWEFYNIWETPFSPTDFDFPCTLGRPEGVSEDQMRNMMYLANHNLNAEIAIGGLSILVPNVAQIKETNGVEGNGSLGLMTTQCTEKWDRPPNFLLVDFYNQGPTNGSVFEVAARANGVTYNRPCCGRARSDAADLMRPSVTYFGFVVAVAVALLL